MRQKTYATRAQLEATALSGRSKTSKYMECGEEKTKASFAERFRFLTLAKKFGARGFRIALIAVVVLISLG